MRGLLATLILATVLVPARAETERPDVSVRLSAATVGRALSLADPGLLDPLLPDRGKVRMRLVSLGPEDGHFSRGQVRALLGSFLREGSVSEFRIVSIEGANAPYAMVQARAAVIDRFGRPARVVLHLGFVRESDRWVLRELREAAA